MLYHDKNQMTIKEAKERCKSLDSTLVEFWTDEEWNEVIMNRNLIGILAICIWLLCIRLNYLLNLISDHVLGEVKKLLGWPD